MHIGPLPIPNLETIRGVPSATWYTLTGVVSAGWLAGLVFALALFLAAATFVGAKESQSLWPIWFCFVFFPVIVSFFAWIIILVLKAVIFVTTGVIFLLILAFGILSWVMWIKDVWEARHEILKRIEKRHPKVLPAATAD